jgi:hypothetical protein
VSKWALEQWKDKGMVTLIYYGFVDKEGKVRAEL